jgi:CRP-like cAMP-binding protein
MAEETITEVQVFEDFTDDEVLTISNYSQKKFYQREEVIFEEKSEDTSLYIVLSGELEVLAKTSENKEVSLSFIDEGEVFGELSFLDGKKRSAKIIAKSDVELLQLTRNSFDRLRLEHPDIASKLIMDLARVISLRLRNADKFIVDIFEVINKDNKLKKASAKKTATKKVADKKAPAKKSVDKTTAKKEEKTSAKKTATKKVADKKAPAKKSVDKTSKKK